MIRQCMVSTSISAMQVTYEIVGGNDEKKFGIDDSGVIALLDTLDFETRKSYELIVQGTPGYYFNFAYNIVEKISQKLLYKIKTVKNDVQQSSQSD